MQVGSGSWWETERSWFGSFHKQIEWILKILEKIEKIVNLVEVSIKVVLWDLDCSNEFFSSSYQKK